MSQESVKISSLELENVKRIRALQLEPTTNGLTVIGGDNAQGKTSVLDAIAWALGGKKYQPDNPTRDGAATPAKLHVELSNGIVVERKGKNGTLRVTDATGARGAQKLLDEFLSTLALDLPKFLDGTDKQRNDALLQTLGIDKELAALDGKIRTAMEDRTDTGRQARTMRAHADALPHHDDAPDEPLMTGELGAKLMEAMNTNAENQRKRDDATQLMQERDEMLVNIDGLRAQIEKLEEKEREVAERAKEAWDEAQALADVDTTELQEQIANADSINEKVRANQAKANAEGEAKKLEDEYEALTQRIDALRGERAALLDGAPLPLEGLSINDDGALTYDGQTWGDMSSAERLRVGTAIAHAVKPECGFVLVDELERFDAGQLAEFAKWAEGEGLQVIGTRVAKDDTCTVIIEDGRIAEQDKDEPATPGPKGKVPAWGGASF